jgi:hypothetical protein
MSPFRACPVPFTRRGFPDAGPPQPSVRYAILKRWGMSKQVAGEGGYHGQRPRPQI